MVRVKFYSDIAYSGFLDDLKSLPDLDDVYPHDGEASVSFSREVWLTNKTMIEGLVSDYGGIITR
jgi:hypothetical protein